MAWKARVVLFMGFAAMAGGLAGGISVMVLKYVTQGAQGNQLWFGVSNLVANGLVMLRYGKPIADVGSATRLTETQFRDTVGQPEHGGRLHLQSSFVNPTEREQCMQQYFMRY
jgi:hypothetical protein